MRLIKCPRQNDLCSFGCDLTPLHCVLIKLIFYINSGRPTLVLITAAASTPVYLQVLHSLQKLLEYFDYTSVDDSGENENKGVSRQRPILTMAIGVA